MARLVVLSGYSGSGKSTLARELERYGRFAVVRSDDYHHCYEPGMDVTWLLLNVAASFGNSGVSVIVDAVNKHPGDYVRWSALGRTIFGGRFEWIDMGVPVAECIRRDALRPKPVGAEAILSQLCVV